MESAKRNIPRETKRLNFLEKQLGLQTNIKWKLVFVLFIHHVSAFYWSYLYAFPAKWQTIALALVMYIISISSMTCGVHRLWTHRCYKAKLPLRIYLMLSFTSSGTSTIFQWIRDHRLHHKYCDTDADPHNSNRGFFFAHIGWLLMEKNDLVKKKGSQIDCSDVWADPILAFEYKYAAYLRPVTCIILPTITNVLLLGETWQCALAWQFFIRHVLVMHGIWSVNSFGHLCGHRPYNKYIKPTQNWFVSLVALGEGSHNYHHTFPLDYKAAESFDLFNLSTFFIRIWAKMGLAYDLKEQNANTVQAMVDKQKLLSDH